MVGSESTPWEMRREADYWASLGEVAPPLYGADVMGTLFDKDTVSKLIRFFKENFKTKIIIR